MKTARQQAQEFLNEFGMERLLYSLILIQDDHLAKKEEQYLRTLRDNLQKTLETYIDRY